MTTNTDSFPPGPSTATGPTPATGPPTPMGPERPAPVVATRPSPLVRRAVGLGVVAATLPYLTLKIAWLSGSVVGLRDAAFAAAPGMTALNLVTAGLDGVAILVALALTLRWGRRLPAWMPISTMWIGAGLLVPGAVLFVLGMLLGGPTGPEPLEAWVRPMVYGGFTAQGVLLVVAFVGYAADRWPAVLHPAAESSAGLNRTLGRGAAVPLVGVAVLRLVEGVTGPAGAGPWVFALLLLGAVAGGLAVTEGRGGPVAVAAAWVGTGGAVGWGLYATANTLAGTVFAGSGSPEQLADLAQVLGGLVLGIAVLIVLVGRVAAGSR